MAITLETANERHVDGVHDWLRAEEEETGEGFYCNWPVVRDLFVEGNGTCAIIDNVVVGFCVYQIFSEKAKIQIIEIHPSHRKHGVGSMLFKTTIDKVKELGALYIDVECTSGEGEALCRRYGFEDYKDPGNHRNAWDSPTLRKYLSAWRPPVRTSWY